MTGKRVEKETTKHPYFHMVSKTRPLDTRRCIWHTVSLNYSVSRRWTTSWDRSLCARCVAFHTVHSPFFLRVVWESNKERWRADCMGIFTASTSGFTTAAKRFLKYNLHPLLKVQVWRNQSNQRLTKTGACVSGGTFEIFMIHHGGCSFHSIRFRSGRTGVFTSCVNVRQQKCCRFFLY